MFEGQEEYRLTGQEMPWAEVTAVERVGTTPATGAVTGSTIGVTDDLDARTSALVLDSDLPLDDDGGVLVAAATLLAGAAYPRPGTGTEAHRCRQA